MSAGAAGGYLEARMAAETTSDKSGRHGWAKLKALLLVAVVVSLVVAGRAFPLPETLHDLRERVSDAGPVAFSSRAYEGTIPGPTLMLRPGDTMRLLQVGVFDWIGFWIQALRVA